MSLQDAAHLPRETRMTTGHYVSGTPETANYTSTLWQTRSDMNPRKHRGHQASFTMPGTAKQQSLILTVVMKLDKDASQVSCTNFSHHTAQHAWCERRWRTLMRGSNEAKSTSGMTPAMTIAARAFNGISSKGRVPTSSTPIMLKAVTTPASPA